MKLLLTSNGLVNKSIQDALAVLLQKPYSDARVVFIPTAVNPERGDKTWLANDYKNIASMGWTNFDVIDLAAAANLQKELWWPTIEESDCIIIGGGNTFYLCYWLWQSGLADKLPELLRQKVYVGISAGSMAATHGLQAVSISIDKFGTIVHKDEEYNEFGPKGQSSAKTLKLVDFVVRPHWGRPSRARITDDMLSELVAELDVPLYAIDDDTAIKVVDKTVEVISEGKWKLYNK